MFEEFAIFQAFISLLGFVVTLKHFKGGMRYLSIALLSDLVSNIAYIFFPTQNIFTIDYLVISVMILFFFLHIRRYRRVL